MAFYISVVQVMFHRLSMHMWDTNGTEELEKESYEVGEGRGKA